MSLPSKQHHKDTFHQSNMHDLIDEATNHIEDYKEVRKPLEIKFSDNTTRTRSDMFSVVRRYRVGRTYFYRMFIDAPSFYGPPTNFPTHQTSQTTGGVITFATTSDFPELLRLSHSQTMSEPVFYTREYEGMGSENSSNSITLNGHFRLSPKTGLTLMYDYGDSLPTLTSPTTNETAIFDFVKNKLVYNKQFQYGSSYTTYHPTDKGIEIMTGTGMPSSTYGWTVIGQAVRNIYEEEDER